MFPMDRLSHLIAIEIEYDSRGRRVRKGFADIYAGRRFYTAKVKAGANPKVCKPGSADQGIQAKSEGDE